VDQNRGVVLPSIRPLKCIGYIANNLMCVALKNYISLLNICMYPWKKYRFGTFLFFEFYNFLISSSLRVKMSHNHVILSLFPVNSTVAHGSSEVRATNLFISEIGAIKSALPYFVLPPFINRHLLVCRFTRIYILKLV
jgi:hypothetical protein